MREGKDKASSQSSATKEAEHRMGKVDIGGCRIEVDDIRQVAIFNGPTAIEYRYSHFYFAVCIVRTHLPCIHDPTGLITVFCFRW